MIVGGNGCNGMRDWKLGEVQYNTYLSHWLLDSCWRAEDVSWSGSGGEKICCVKIGAGV